MKTKATTFLALMVLMGAFFMFSTVSAMAKCGTPEYIPQMVTEEPAPPSSLPTPILEETLPPPTSAVVAPPITTGNPFTPDGVATVIDNVTSDDGKEFFTFTTPEGNVFFLVIDRSRPRDNVYFLNAVTEHDLLALTERTADTPSFSPIPEPLPTPEPDDDPTEDTDPLPDNEQQGSGNNGTLIFIVIAALAFGGTAYYLKIVRPKKQGAAFDDDDEYDYEDEEAFDDDEDDDELKEIYDVDEIIREFGNGQKAEEYNDDDEEEQLFDEIQ